MPSPPRPTSSSRWPDATLRIRGVADAGVPDAAIRGARLPRLGIHALALALTLSTAAASEESLVRAEALARKTAIYQQHVGSLFLHGGGSVSPPLVEAFLRAAGGKGSRLAVLLTGSDDEHAERRSFAFWKTQGFGRVLVLRAENREKASDAAFCARLGDVDAVWLSGADEARVAEVFGGTALERALRDVLRRGAVVGSGGAGAASLCRVALLPGKDRTRLGIGLSLLEGAIVDTGPAGPAGFTELARTLEQQRGHFGLGLEPTAAVHIRGRRVQVLGEGRVHLHLGPGAGREASRSLYLRGSRMDLVQLRRAAVSRIRKGKIAWDKPAGLEKGTLWIAGGGSLPDSIWRGFLSDCGGVRGRIVVIPTATGKQPAADAVYAVRKLRELGAERVHVLDAHHWLDIDEEFLGRIDTADGIWITGGRQWRLVDRYARTGVVAALRRLLARGGVVGGSSAGASIQADCLVRGHPLSNGILMAEGYERGFGLLPGTAIDQHFSQRNRLAGLTKIKRRWPELLCLGIDEGTAARIRQSELRCVGTGVVHVLDREANPPRRLGSGATYALPTAR